MVSNQLPQKAVKTSRVRRVMYSTLGLSLIGTTVAVLGAPLKWGIVLHL